MKFIPAVSEKIGVQSLNNERGIYSLQGHGNHCR